MNKGESEEEWVAKEISENKHNCLGFNNVKCVECRGKKYINGVGTKIINKRSIVDFIVYDEKNNITGPLYGAGKDFDGHSPSLLNASGRIALIFEISKDIKNDIIDKINNLRTIKEKISYINYSGFGLVFKRFKNEDFQKKILNISNDLPVLLSHSILEYFGSGDKFLSNLQINKKTGELDKFLENVLKGKHLLKEQVCPEFFLFYKDKRIIKKNINDAIKSLVKYVYFDTPSATRHKFGKIYKMENKLYINLNFQIRIDGSIMYDEEFCK